jgi:hypothetical protein
MERSHGRQLPLGLTACLLQLALVSCLAVHPGRAGAAGPSWSAHGERYDCEELGGGTGLYNTLLECLGGPEASGSGKWKPKALTGTSGQLALYQGATALVTKKTGSGSFKIKAGSIITIECTSLNAPASLVGGVPAKGHILLQLSGCTVAGHPSCTVKSPSEPTGTIATSSKSEIVYIGTEAQAGKEEGKLGDYLQPESGEVFVEVVVGGSGCPLFTPGEQEIKGSVIAEIQPVGALAKTLELTFPATSISKGYRWLKKGEVMLVSASLKAFGILGATAIGEAEAKQCNEEEWEVTDN